MKDATTDEATIRQWWTRWPSAPIAVRTGEPDSFLAIDDDSPRKGGDGLAALEKTYGPLPETTTVRTGGGGEHRLFKPIPGIGNRTGLPGSPSVDVRGENGYVIVPPSAHASGRRYEWLGQAERIAELPEAWARLLTRDPAQVVETVPAHEGNGDFTTYRKALAAMLCQKIPNAESDGSKRLLSVACRAVEYGLDDPHALRAIRQYETIAPFPKRWADSDIIARIADARKKTGPIHENGAAAWPMPVAASELGGGEQVSFVWHGYLAVGFVTLLTGLWKAGKTTLIGYLLRAFQNGGDLAGEVHPGRVLIVSEEGAGLWARRRDDLHFGDSCEFICRPFKSRPQRGAWESFVCHLAELVRKRGFKVVILDTIAGLLPVDNENDAAQMQTALMPLHAVTELGAAVLLAHHPRKGDAGEGQAARGSGALPGFVDVILELRRYAAQDREDRRRTLTAYSRFDETPGEVVIELGDEGYRLVGGKADAKRTDRLAVIGDILPTSGPGRTAEELRAAWPEGDGIPQPGIRTLRSDLKGGVDSGRWLASGTGTKGDPTRYWLADNSIPAPIGNDLAGMESQAVNSGKVGNSAPLNSIPASPIPIGAGMESSGGYNLDLDGIAPAPAFDVDDADDLERAKRAVGIRPASERGNVQGSAT